MVVKTWKVSLYAYLYAKIFKYIFMNLSFSCLPAAWRTPDFGLFSMSVWEGAAHGAGQCSWCTSCFFNAYRNTSSTQQSTTNLSFFRYTQHFKAPVLSSLPFWYWAGAFSSSFAVFLPVNDLMPYCFHHVKLFILLFYLSICY